MTPEASVVVACEPDPPGRPVAWLPDHYDVTVARDPDEVLAALGGDHDLFVLDDGVWSAVAAEFCARAGERAPKVLVLGTPEPEPIEHGLGVSLGPRVSEQAYRRALSRLERVRAYERTLAELFRRIGERLRLEAAADGDPWEDPAYLDLVVETDRLRRRAEHLALVFDEADYDVALASLRMPESATGARA